MTRNLGRGRPTIYDAGAPGHRVGSGGETSDLPHGCCPSCGGLLTTENFAEATITRGECGYSWASHFGGGEPQIEPCRKASS